MFALDRQPGRPGGSQTDYVPHHIWSQYFTSTANPTHARPTSTKAIGYTTVPGTKKIDPANHNYDLADFFTAVGSGNFPAVSLIKMAAFQDAHPGNSDPLDEQTGLVNLINFLQQQPDWDSTAVIIAYDDSDGWYDHGFAKTTSASFSSSDALNGAGLCGAVGTTEPTGVNGLPVAGRCGPGTRQPFLVISPYAKKNYVSHVQITQASIPQFIEDNWLNGAAYRRRLLRCHDRFDRRHVQLQQGQQREACPRSDHRLRGHQGQVQEQLSRSCAARSCGSSAPVFWPAPTLRRRDASAASQLKTEWSLSQTYTCVSPSFPICLRRTTQNCFERQRGKR